MTPAPNWPECEGQVIGSYKLIKYLGYYRRGHSLKAHHRYLVECTRCGNRAQRIQNSLVKGARVGTKGCINCCKARDKTRDTDRRREKIEKEQRDRAEWIALMQLWPATDLKWRGGFDSEKVQELRKFRRW